MPITVDSAVAEVVGRLKGYLAFGNLSVVTDHTNPDVVPAVRDGLWYFNLSPAGYPALTDADLSRVRDPKWFLDAATLQCLYRIRGAMQVADSFDQKVDGKEQKLSQVTDHIDGLIADYLKRVPDPTLGRGAMGVLPSPCVPDYRRAPGCCR